MTKLNPCPFCGGKAKWDKDWQAVVCTNCGASTRHSILVTRKKNESIEAWNRRAEIKGNQGKTSTNWHTGTPTEEGWYLIAFLGANKRIEYASAVWCYNEWDAHCQILAWQKINPYEEVTK